MEELRFPVLFNLGLSESKNAFEELIRRNPSIELIDQIESQIGDYIKTVHPDKKFSSEEISLRILEHLGGVPIKEYGSWVYYPWKRQVIHLLGEKEFTSLRTDRNKNKITAAEQKALSNKKIGLIGLSVGHAVALTLAMERTFGELRIADHDHLDLSNLNRIRSSVHNIGVLKTTIVCREIAEIDPYLKVTCFDHGITEENLDSFLSSGGQLDILIDECDSLDIKLQCREKAKELGIPVVMETSDRGMLDVERFDLDPELPILWGHLNGLKSSDLKGLTNEEKIPYVLPIIGLEKSSLRLRSSMFEVEQSISTWPQLGSDVAMGGGTVAHVVRRILLGEPITSSRTYVDLEEILPLIAEEKNIIIEPEGTEDLDPNQLISKIETLGNASPEFSVNREHLEALVGKAALAPSGGNTQPWLWHIANDKLYLFLDTRKPFAFLDFKYRGSMVALGAASKNVELAATEFGLKTKIESFDIQGEESYPLVASFSFEPSRIQVSELFPAIDKRLTNRLNEGRHPLPDQFVSDALDSYNGVHKCSTLRIIDSNNGIETVKSVLSVTDRLVMMNPKGHRDLYGELKWDKDFSEVEGINVHTLGLTAQELSGMEIAKDPKVIENLREIGGGARFSEMNHKAIESTSAIGMVTITGFEAQDFFNAGKEIQEHWLRCTNQGISVYPFTGGIYLINRVQYGSGENLSSHEVSQLQACKQELSKLFEISKDEVMAFMFRYSVTNNQPVRSKRKSIKEILL